HVVFDGGGKTITDPKDGSQVKNVKNVQYVAYISDKENEDADGKSYGLYNIDHTLYLSSDTYLTAKYIKKKETTLNKGIKKPEKDSPDKVGTSVHELFHAIENAYMGDEQFRGGNKYDWMTEGMADAVILAYQKKMFGGSGSNLIKQQYSKNDRYYDYPLHEPKDVNDNSCGECYSTRIFWYTLGEIIRSEDNIAYLHDVLSEDMKPNAGIDALHKTLQKYKDEGLYHYYPEFIRKKNNRKWIRGLYDNPVIETYTFNNQKQKKTHTGTAKKIATNAYGFVVKMPANKVAGVRIAFETDNPDLHLIVNEERFDLPKEISLTEERNIFRTTVTKTDTFYVRVANVAPNPGESVDKNYKLTVELTPIDPCSGDLMLSTIHPHFIESAKATSEMTDQLSGLIGMQSGGQFTGLANIIKPAAEFERDFEPVEGMHPSKGNLVFTGLVSDRGDACVDHIGTNPMLDVAGEDGEMDEAAMEGRLEDMFKDMQNMSPEEMEKIMQKTISITDQMLKGAPQLEDETMLGEMMESIAGTEGSTLLKIYSPNALSWQLDIIADARSFKHGGVGGWRANSAAQIFIKLKGISPSQLEEKKSYEVEMVLESADDEAELEAYLSWNGREHLLPKEEDDLVQSIAFEGKTNTVYLNKITGTVTITKITGADVQGTLNLIGYGYKEVEQSEFTYDDKNRIDGDTI
ncbi:MAG: hypothetical protein AB8B69_23070, partial [Chitinophagales bacterium]